MRLTDKVVLITGSYTGIGLAIAHQCIQEGAKVFLNGLHENESQKVMAGFPVGSIAHLTLDITLESAAEALVGAVIDHFGRLDCLVNNAALVASSNIENTSVAYLRHMLDVNTVAPFALIQAAMPHLKKTQGNVVNIGSINAWCGEPNLLAYSMSKGALMTMSRNLGDSLFRDHGVRVNQINPGWVLTANEIAKQREAGKPENWQGQVPPIFAPSKRLFSPEELAQAAVFLMDDASGPISGQVIEIEQFPMIGRNLDKSW